MVRATLNTQGYLHPKLLDAESFRRTVVMFAYSENRMKRARSMPDRAIGQLGGFIQARRSRARFRLQRKGFRVQRPV
jgi:hypothetical protein